VLQEAPETTTAIVCDCMQQQRVDDQRRDDADLNIPNLTRVVLPSDNDNNNSSLVFAFII
jgi:hypothetical protein